MLVTTPEKQITNDIRRWFGWLVIIGPIHMSEQLLFGIDELYELKRFAAAFYGLFRNPDYASVVLVIFSFTIVNLIVYGLLVGGRWRRIALGVFAMVGLGEVHHVVKTVLHGSYFPGAVTSIPFVIFGALLFRSLISEFRIGRETRSTEVPARLGSHDKRAACVYRGLLFRAKTSLPSADVDRLRPSTTIGPKTHQSWLPKHGDCADSNNSFDQTTLRRREDWRIAQAKVLPTPTLHENKSLPLLAGG